MQKMTGQRMVGKERKKMAVNKNPVTSKQAYKQMKKQQASEVIAKADVKPTEAATADKSTSTATATATSTSAKSDTKASSK